MDKMKRVNLFIVALSAYILFWAYGGWAEVDQRFSRLIMWVVSLFKAPFAEAEGVMAKPTPFLYQEENAFLIGLLVSLSLSLWAGISELRTVVTCGRSGLSAGIISFAVLTLIFNVRLFSWAL